MLATVLAPWLCGPIEHIGSTAVPGLGAKPVIDIMAGVPSLESSRPAISLLADLDYLYAPYRADVMHWLCKPSPEVRTHHLHLVPFGSTLWKERIEFRNRLIASRRLADEYETLKRRLAKDHAHDREAYTDAKSNFISAVLAGSI